MTATDFVWEQDLLGRAYQAFTDRATRPVFSASQSQLQAAYAHCAALTRRHSQTFFLASGLLPREQRQAARALYAFCRVSDDLVDRPGGDRPARLTKWRRRALAAEPDASDPVALAWADTRARYGIPRLLAEQLLDGVARDLKPTRYGSFAELAEYCYSVASTVGLMSMTIVGYAGEGAIPYAVRLGVALQLTNVLRDVAEDWANGRLYLPLEEMAAFNLSEADIAAGRNDRRWKAFMRFQIWRTRQLYADSLPGVAMLGDQGRFAIAAAAELYRAILDQIEAHDYDVFNRRVYVRRAARLRRLPGIWWRSRTSRYESLKGHRDGRPALLAVRDCPGLTDIGLA